MGRLILPRQYVQMSQPVIFWFCRTLDHIMCPPSPVAPPPTGYQRIECRHAHEVDKWSARLRAQEKRMRDMNDEERYNFEEPIRAHGIAILREQLAKATDKKNRIFLATNIALLEQK